MDEIYDEAYEAWLEYKHEAEALGQEWISWEEWSGQYNREEAFKEKWQWIYDNDMQDLY